MKIERVTAGGATVLSGDRLEVSIDCLGDYGSQENQKLTLEFEGDKFFTADKRLRRFCADLSEALAEIAEGVA